MSSHHPDRRATPTARLARLGFTEPEAARRLLERPALAALAAQPWWEATLAAVGDPDQALAGLDALLTAGPEQPLAEALATDSALRARLLQVLGASTALVEHLVRHPADWQVLADPVGLRSAAALTTVLLTAVGADPEAPEPSATGPDQLDRLRRAYRRQLLLIAALDLTGAVTFTETTAALADLAGAALEAGLAIARAELPADAEPCRLAVIAMGKTGGRELNYVSDVDVVFVAESVHHADTDNTADTADNTAGGDEAAALATATRLAAGLMRACSTATPEGSLWEVDAALRPEGKAGPLVRTLASHLAYYQRWAKTWEFQALLKARPVAGDAELGERYVRALTPLVWEAAGRDHFVEDVQAMRRRVEQHLPADQADRQLKLGPGGLRDVEFAVQLLQLVHGRTEPRLRDANTLSALASLATAGYVAREDGAELDAAYQFLRTLEHRIQLHRLRRTHVVPTDPADLRRIGRCLGMGGDPAAELTQRWRQHARQVRRLHEKLFYRPLLRAVAQLDPGEVRLTPDAATARLRALGYQDPAGALRHIQALTTGVNRTAVLQRTLLPVMLGWFADAADPDGGLLAFRRVSEALGRTPWYLAGLRDEGSTAERMARVLASGRLPADLALRAPEAVAMLTDPAELRPRSGQALLGEVRAAVRRAQDTERAVASVRAIRRRELFRLTAADALGLVEAEAVGTGVSDLTAATLAGALQAAAEGWQRRQGRELPTRLAVIGMGRLGGGESQYGSDADVLFVHEPIAALARDEQDAGAAAHAVANEVRALLHAPGTDPALEVDAALRPEGKAGPLVRTLASYTAYYARWSRPWEAQALLRAAPVAGDPGLGERFLALVDPIRYRPEGLDETALREIRRLKARMEAERLPRGLDPARHTKLGPGGLADVEWTVQLWQLQHAGKEPGLRTTRTLVALRAAVELGLVEAEDADLLAQAWRLASRIRDAVMVVRAQPSDVLPTDLAALEATARFLGYAPGGAGELVEEYRRVARRARALVKRVFYGG